METSQILKVQSLYRPDQLSNSNPCFWEQRIQPHEYEFLKSYLYAVFMKKREDGDLTITRCIAHSSLNHRPQFPHTLDSGSEGLPLVPDGVLEVTVHWAGGTYELVASKETLPEGVRFFSAFSLGLTEGSDSPRQLVDLCIRKSMEQSSLKGKVLKVTGFEPSQLRTTEISGRSLDDVFLPQDTLDSIRLFIEAVNQYATVKTPLRYLLSGKPGTGKTETIRAIINACKGQATFFLIEGQTGLKEVFELASSFSPSVICLDDIDLVCGDRMNGRDNARLSEFLSLMDGLIRSDLFVLATTNDKRWVDKAAARPGRFDLILDVEGLDVESYRKLIQSRCTNSSVREQFTDDVVQELSEMKVSGAHVVNLIKQIELQKNLGRFGEAGSVKNSMNRLRNGFEASGGNGDKRVGF